MPFAHFMKGWAAFITLAVSCLLFPAPSLAASHKDPLGKMDQAPVRIDFNDVVSQSGENDRLPCRSLRIAVAAMTSPGYTYRYYVELLDLIGKKMDREIRFVQKKTYAEVNGLLKKRALDLAFVCSGPYVSGRADFGAQILAVPVCHGKSVYHAYFIAALESPFTGFDDFRGKIFAFTDPLSNTGYMVPVYYLARQGTIPGQYFSQTFFTHSHDRSIRAVAEGLADGASVDSLIFEFMQKAEPGLTEKIKIVGKSPPYGIPPVVIHPSLSPAMTSALRQVFFTIHEDPSGRQILDRLQIDRFVQGNDSDYDTVRDLRGFVNSGQER